VLVEDAALDDVVVALPPEPLLDVAPVVVVVVGFVVEDVPLPLPPPPEGSGSVNV